jgi:hypothetical protein
MGYTRVGLERALSNILGKSFVIGKDIVELVKAGAFVCFKEDIRGKDSRIIREASKDLGEQGELIFMDSVDSVVSMNKKDGFSRLYEQGGYGIYQRNDYRCGDKVKFVIFKGDAVVVEIRRFEKVKSWLRLHTF